MNYPSIKTLQSITGDEDSAKKLRAVLTATKRSEVLALSSDAERYQSQCFHDPDFYVLKLYAANEIMEGYGVEAIDIPAGSFNNCQTPDICIEYVNLGDTYTTTLCRIVRHGKVSYRVIDYGTLVERYGD